MADATDASTPADAGFRFEQRYPLRHTDSFGGTPFVHGGVLLALTEIALDAYDGEAGIPSHRDILRFQSGSEVRYRSPLRWDDAALVRLRCTELRPGRLTFEAEVAAASDGRLVAQFTHRYVTINAQSGRPEVPADWDAIVRAVQSYDTAVIVHEASEARR
jgi:acyl-CoA thioesterase FadM